MLKISVSRLLIINIISIDRTFATMKRGSGLVIRNKPYHIRWLCYQKISFLSRKNPPLGPSSGKVANQTGVSAPCAGLSGACGPPISVFTQPGQAEFTRILSLLTWLATNAVRLLTAFLESR
jgi:hypothetical protein